MDTSKEYAAALEAAIAEITRYAGHDTTKLLIQRIRALPIPAEYAVEGSASDGRAGEGERERFEAWWTSKHPLNAQVNLTHFFAHAPDGGYLNARIDSQWRAWQAALATAPSTRIEAEPVACSHPSWKNLKGGKEQCELCGAVGREMRYLSVNDAASPDRTPDARSTSDAAVVLPPCPSHPDHHAMTWTTMEKAAIEVYGRECLALGLADRATRSTDSSAEAAGMERAAKVLEELALAFKHSHPDAIRYRDGAHAIRAEAAKLTTAPRPAEEVDRAERLDAERYRWLRDGPHKYSFTSEAVLDQSSPGLDGRIDEATCESRDASKGGR